MKFMNDEGGATAIEYGLLASLISVVIIGAVTAIGTGLSTTFDTVTNQLSGGNAAIP
jgi:pilus assembly protein Flp/PilA